MTVDHAPSPSSDKAELRRVCRRRRRQAIAAAAAPLLAVAERELPALVPAGQRLGLYHPLGSEADLRQLAARLPGQLALPAVRATEPATEAVRLDYVAWNPGEPLLADACGIPAPAGADALPADALALLLVPALAIDRRGLRLGSGGGWFDRLRADPTWRAVPALAVLPAACVLESIPADPWDVPFHGWLDEHGLHWLTKVSSS